MRPSFAGMRCRPRRQRIPPGRGRCARRCISILRRLDDRRPGTTGRYDRPDDCLPAVKPATMSSGIWTCHIHERAGCGFASLSRRPTRSSCRSPSPASSPPRWRRLPRRTLRPSAMRPAAMMRMRRSRAVHQSCVICAVAPTVSLPSATAPIALRFAAAVDFPRSAEWSVVRRLHSPRSSQGPPQTA